MAKLRIGLVGAQELEPECTHWKGIRLGMEANDVEYYEIDYRKHSAHAVQKRINELDLDVLIWGLIDPFVNPSYVKNCHAKVRAFWHADLRDKRIGGYPDWDMRSQVDMIFLSNAGLCDWYTKNTLVPTHYVAQAGFQGEIIESPYAFKDVVFIGGKLSSGILGQRYHLFQEIQHPFDWINKDTLEERMAVYAQMPTIYNTAKICLDASQVWDIDKYCSGRYFHIACNGGFSICKRFPGCEDLFPEGVGKVYFDTAAEADMLIKYWLNPENQDERKRIQKEGHRRACMFHTYTNRVEDIIKLVT